MDKIDIFISEFYSLKISSSFDTLDRGFLFGDLKIIFAIIEFLDFKEYYLEDLELYECSPAAFFRSFIELFESYSLN